MRARDRMGALLLGGALLLSLAGCSKGGTAAAGTPQIQDTSLTGKTTTYNLQVIEPTDVGRTANLSVSPSYQLIKSVKVSGVDCRIKELRVSRNQHVEAGEVIAVLQGMGSTADVELKRLEIEAFESNRDEMLAYYSAAIENAEAMPSYSENQRKTRELSMEYAQLEYEKYLLQAEYTLSSLEAQLASLEAAAGEVEITAPIAGTVRSLISRSGEGDVVTAGTELCRIYGDDGMCVCGSSSGSAFVYGREVTVRVTKGKRQTVYTGRVISSPEVLPGNTSNLVLMELDVDSADFPESEGSAETVYTVLSGVYAVPKNAITNRDGVSYVEVLIGDSVRTRTVERGPLAGNMVTILHGLHEGDQVVISSYNS